MVVGKAQDMSRIENAVTSPGGVIFALAFGAKMSIIEPIDKPEGKVAQRNGLMGIEFTDFAAEKVAWS